MGNAQSEGASGGCPVKHDAPAAGSCPVIHNGAPAAPASSSQAMSDKGVAAPAGACPVNHGGGETKPSSSRARGTVYNVYAQPIDPTNQMPVVANQLKSPGQTADLSTSRVQSTIPKGGTESSWLYPSPQMFWNALVRKNKADGVHESDMDTVVSIHNEMNERAWRKVMEWEDLHKGEHLEGEPSLRRFMGKPYDLSPKAQIKSWLGYGFPFDRHDWTVDRNGKEVRYIIDYYFNPLEGANVALPVGSGPTQLIPSYTKAIHVDVRPAIDDATSAWDRFKRFPERVVDSFKVGRFKAEGLDPATAPKEAAAFALHSSDGGPKTAPTSSQGQQAQPLQTGAVSADKADPLIGIVDSKCAPMLTSFKAAATEDDKRTAHVGLTYCMATVLCSNEAKDFMSVLEKKGSDPNEEEASFQFMSACVLKEMLARRAPPAGGAPSRTDLK